MGTVVGWDFVNQTLYDDITNNLILDSYVEKLCDDDQLLSESDWKISDVDQGGPKDPNGHFLEGCPKHPMRVLANQNADLTREIADVTREIADLTREIVDLNRERDDFAAKVARYEKYFARNGLELVWL